MIVVRYEELKELLNIDNVIIGSMMDIDFNKISVPDDSDKDSMVWLNESNSNNIDLLNSITCNTLIAHTIIDEKIINHERIKVLIKDSNPKSLFTRIVQKFFIAERIVEIHQTAIISNKAIIGQNVYIGPNCTIGNCSIGNNCIIEANVVIADSAIIGDRTIIKSFTNIGSKGFGFVKDEKNQWVQVPHIGGVEIGTDVYIGSNTCIDRGTIGNTKIGNNSKIDNLIHIAHNVIIGESTLIIAKSIIGGSTQIGNNCWIAPSVTIRDGLKIVDNVTVGMGSVVTKDLTESGVYLGTPAIKKR